MEQPLMKFYGSIPALITPFINGLYHPQTLSKLIDWHCEQGSSALVIGGTTGECPTLTFSEHILIIKDAARFSNNRIPIIAGAGSNSTQEAIDLSVASEHHGASALLHVTGYYNKPSQDQVVGHFTALDKATNLPIIVYNIPSRTGQELTIQTIKKLSELDHVVGVKDSTGNVSRITQEKLLINKPFSFLSGDDSTSLGYLAHGGHGCISVTANIAPYLCSQLFSRMQKHDLMGAREINDLLTDLHLAIFLEPSPAGVKYAMNKLGLCTEEVRMPITQVGLETRLKIDAAMARASLHVATSITHD